MGGRFAASYWPFSADKEPVALLDDRERSDNLPRINRLILVEIERSGVEAAFLGSRMKLV